MLLFVSAKKCGPRTWKNISEVTLHGDGPARESQGIWMIQETVDKVIWNKDIILIGNANDKEYILKLFQIRNKNLFVRIVA